MQLHFTDYRRLTASGDDLSALKDRGVPDAMPFVLGQDAVYDTILSGFLRSLPNSRCPSPRTWAAYGRDIVTWTRFCETQGVPVLGVERAQFDAYRNWRLLNDSPALRVDANSWTRGISAIAKFYDWAVEEGLLARSPVPFNFTSSGGGGRNKRRNLATAKHVRRGDIRFLSLADYDAWLSVGICGRRPDGTPDPEYRGRNPERDEALAELLARSGLRIQEACSLLLGELPAPESDRRWYPLTLVSAVTKGTKTRTVELRAGVLRKIGHYTTGGRAGAIARASSRGRYEGGDFIRATSSGPKGVRLQLAGRLTPWRKLDPTLRERLLLPVQGGIEPASLWLTERGAPASTATFRELFLRANERCSRWGLGLPEVHPHMLRHTYAVHTLQRLIRNQLVAIAPGRPDGPDRLRNPYAFSENALLRLARLLGHSSVTSTFDYLHCLNDAQALIDDAFESSEAASLEELDAVDPVQP